MSCIVPTCLGIVSEGSTRTFPQNSALAQRWLRAIQIGCQLGGGSDPVIANFGSEGSNICDAHFDCHQGRVMNDLYVEPTLFCDSQGVSVSVLTCSICLEFYTQNELLRCDQILDYRTVQFDMIEKLLGTKIYSSTFVCMECVAKLEVISSVCSFFELCHKSINSLEEIIDKVVEDNLDQELRRGANVDEAIKLEPEEPVSNTKNNNTLKKCQKKKLTSHKKISCTICQNDFKSKTTLRRHMIRLHPNEKPFKRQACTKTFKAEKSYLTHQEPRSNVENFQCQICQKTFETRKGLSSHNIVHSIHERFECKICGKVFNYNSGLKIHLKNVHNDIASLIVKCKKCDLNFPSEDDFRQHSSEIHGDNQPFSCDECNTRYKHKAHLVSHIKFRHQNKPPNKCHCLICNLGHLTLAELKVHIRNEHDGTEYPSLSCADCKKTFIAATVLQRHRFVHTDRYGCKICAKRFEGTTQLRRHLRLIHRKAAAVAATEQDDDSRANACDEGGKE
ncbi:zinc finger protein OZF-like [Uranotaenia lowii]|uniref:zinc finger protein OZF-like n=1 Tax=Uranotaenia lowii TaxID=190385 RepID=UPI002479F350|nr:zinc finger protein OZF-like [Uranotaenia lowii]